MKVIVVKDCLKDGTIQVVDGHPEKKNPSVFNVSNCKCYGAIPFKYFGREWHKDKLQAQFAVKTMFEEKILELEMHAESAIKAIEEAEL